MVCLPEHFAYMSQEMNSGNFEYHTKFKERIDGTLFNKYKQLALDNQVWLSLGSFPEEDEKDPGVVYQTHAIINTEGNITATYRKMHMFDASLSNDEDSSLQAVYES